MSPAGAGRVEVVLVGLPGFYEWLLRSELALDRDVRVTRLGEGTDGAAQLTTRGTDIVIVTGTAATSLRAAGELAQGGWRILGTVAVTDDEPRGDVYLVAPAGRNVTRRELAAVVRGVVLKRRLVTRETTVSHDEAAHAPDPGLTRSDP